MLVLYNILRWSRAIDKYFILGVLNFLFIKLITSANLSLSDILYLQTLLSLSGSRLPVLKPVS